MQYFKGTLQQCEAYNTKVCKGENYSGVTQRWSDVIKHYELDLYCIMKHEKYDSELETIDNIDDWHEPLIIDENEPE